VSPRTKQLLQFTLGIVLAAVLLVWGLPHFAQTTWGEIWRIIRSIPLTHAIFFQLLMLGGLWCYTFTFTGSLRGLSHPKALVINLCGSSVSNLLPGGGAVGLGTSATGTVWGGGSEGEARAVAVRVRWLFSM